MATVRTINRLIRAILSDVLNIYNPGQTIAAADAQTVKEAIQDRLAAWASFVTIPIITTETFAMTAAKASYTVGEGAYDKNSQRPEQIVGAYVRVSNYDYPVSVWTEAQYRSITDKTSSGRPEVVYPKYGTPAVTLYLYPVPDSTDAFYFSSLKTYTEPTTYTEDTFATMGVPGVVYNALKWRVAVDLAPAYRAELHPSVVANVRESYEDMIAQNLARNMTPAFIEMALSGAQGGGYSLQDFFAGE